MPKIKVNLYKVTRVFNQGTLPQLLQKIQSDTLNQRVRKVGHHDVRLEHIWAPGDRGNTSPYWLLDFVKVRMEHGPGKVGVNTPIQGFALANNEGFGEETAALYDPVRDFMLVQYNHYGVRGPTIERYLNSYDDTFPEQFGLDIKLDDTAEAKLAAKQFITKLKVKIAPGQMTAAHRHNNVSLQRALELNDAQGGNTVEFEITATRGQCLAPGAIGRMMNTLRNWRQADRDEGTGVLPQFQVEAKANLADRAERIDMLLPALEVSIDGVILGPDRRYTIASRLQALARARAGWAGIIR